MDLSTNREGEEKSANPLWKGLEKFKDLDN